MYMLTFLSLTEYHIRSRKLKQQEKDAEPFEKPRAESTIRNKQDPAID